MAVVNEVRRFRYFIQQEVETKQWNERKRHIMQTGEEPKDFLTRLEDRDASGDSRGEKNFAVGMVMGQKNLVSAGLLRVSSNKDATSCEATEVLELNYAFQPNEKARDKKKMYSGLRAATYDHKSGGPGFRKFLRRLVEKASDGVRMPS